MSPILAVPKRKKGKNECTKHGKKSEVNRQDPLVRRSFPSLGRAVERRVVLLRGEVDLARRVGGRRRVPAAAGGTAAGGARPAPRVHVFLGQELVGRMGVGQSFKRAPSKAACELV